MASTAPPSILIEVGLKYAKEYSQTFGTQEEETLRKSLDWYLLGKKTIDDMKSDFSSTIGNSAPADKIAMILWELNRPPLPITPEIATNKGIRCWNEAEDRRLLAGIYQFGLENWTKVSEFVGSGRKRSQCSQRWSRGLDPEISKLMWSKKEDEELLELVKKYGEGSWTKISRELRNRTDAQCRFHYKQVKARSEKPQVKQVNELNLGIWFPTDSTDNGQAIQAIQALQSTENSETAFDLQKNSKVLIPPISTFTDDQNCFFPLIAFNAPALPK
jgi:hypothetical protein